MSKGEAVFQEFVEEIPDQTGKIALITGATSGIGFEAAKVLAAKGADVMIASRDSEKGERVIEEIQAANPKGAVSFKQLDTSSLESVRNFARDWDRPIDYLVLNAGVSNVPTRQVTEDGFERQFATNYLGHFALAVMLLPYVKDEPTARIVTTDSLAAARTHLDLDDLQLEEGYSPMKGYESSKLALLTFTLELAKRAEDAGKSYRVIATHPGVASTGITRGGDKDDSLKARLSRWMFGRVGQSAQDGSMPMLYALTSQDAQNGGYYGPSGIGERKGLLGSAKVPEQAVCADLPKRLWSTSEGLASVSIAI